MQESISTQARIVLDNIRHRRTLVFRHFKPDPIHPDHVQAILEAGNWAPTHLFTEPWRFVLFSGEGRQQLARVLTEVYTETSGEAFKAAKFEKTRNRALQVPLTIAVAMKRNERLPEFEEILAVGCAVQNMHLAAHSLGIGLSWSTPRYVDHPKIHQLLAISGEDRCFGFLYLGYPLHDGVWPTSKRGPLEDKITHIDS